MNLRNYYLLLLGLLILSHTHAQPLSTARLDSLFNELWKNRMAMGTVTIAKKGETLYSKSIGYSHLRDTITIRAGAKTRYRLGTASQLLTAAMVLKLAEQGKLNLENKLVDYFPDIINSHLITITQLLQHRSGLFNYQNDSSGIKNSDKPMAKESFLKLLSREFPDSKPNKAQIFNSANYVLLGYIIEEVTGKSYAAALKELITDPLELKDTYYASDVPNPAKDEARPFLFEDNKWLRAMDTHPSVLHAAGGIVSTAADMTAFMTALGKGKVISMASLERMLGESDQYSLGMLSFQFAGKEIYGLIGSVDGFMSAILYEPDSAIAIAYLSNGQRFLYEEVLDGIFKITFNQPYSIPRFKSIPISPLELQRFAGTYTIPGGAPVKIEIFIKDNEIYSRLSGREAVKMIVIGPDRLRNEPGGVYLDFNPARTEISMEQSDGLFLFVRE